MTTREHIKIFFQGVASAIGQMSVIVFSIAVGFALGYLVFVSPFGKKKSEPSMPPAAKIEMTSVAVNERGELIIIDRATGKYQVFADSVGKAIFNVYAGQMYAKMSTK